MYVESRCWQGAGNHLHHPSSRNGQIGGSGVCRSLAHRTFAWSVF